MITLKEITIDDLEFARKLRNNNRQYFFNSKEIDEETHLDWFNKVQLDNHFWFFIIWLDKERIGTISVKEEFEGTEIGNVIIDKKYREKGYLKQVIEEINKLLDKLDKPFYVKVIPSNTIAIVAYEAIGFKEKERILWK